MEDIHWTDTLSDLREDGESREYILEALGAEASEDEIWAEIGRIDAVWAEVDAESAAERRQLGVTC